jgi:hypothetical protein
VTRALGVFHDDCTTVPARLFGRPGFRHAFASVAVGGYWITVDGCEGVAAVRVMAGADYDLAAFYRDCGYTVVETEVRADGPWWPWMSATCVGVVKRMLAIRAPWVMTPWQLYRYLMKEI